MDDIAVGVHAWPFIECSAGPGLWIDQSKISNVWIISGDHERIATQLDNVLWYMDLW